MINIYYSQLCMLLDIIGIIIPRACGSCKDRIILTDGNHVALGKLMDNLVLEGKYISSIILIK